MTTLELLLSGGVTVSLAATLGKYLEHLWLSRNKTSSIQDTILHMTEIYNTMHKVVSKTQAQKFVIFKAENGGGIPKLGSPLFISAIMAVFDAPFLSIDKYQRLRVDAEYTKMLSQLLLNNHIRHNVEELSSSLLKSIYTEADIREANLYLLHATKDAIYYCSIASHKDSKCCSTEDYLAMQIAASKISDLLSKVIK